MMLVVWPDNYENLYKFDVPGVALPWYILYPPKR